MIRKNLNHLFGRALLTCFIVNIYAIAPTYSAEKALAEPLVDMELLQKQFISEFARLMDKHMFGDGTDPTIMPTSKTIAAQRDFRRVLDRNPKLKGFALHLNEFLRDLRHSQEFKQASIKRLIESELLGHITPEAGYATDYVPPKHSIRHAMLLKMHETLALKDLPDHLRKNALQNVIFDFTTIDHLSMQFDSTLQLFEMNLKYYELDQLQQQPKTPLLPPSDSGLTGEERDLYLKLIEDVNNQYFLFNCDLILMEVEKEEQSCRLFLPLLKAMLCDKNTSRTLKNSDKKTLESINKSLKKYEDMRSRFKVHLQNFEMARKKQSPSFKAEAKARVEEVKQLPAPAQAPQEQQNRKEESEVAQPSVVTTTPPAVTAAVVEPTTEKKTKILSDRRTKKKPASKDDEKDSPQVPKPQPNDDHLTEWLMNVSPPRSRRQPAEQDLKQERKRQAKEEKRKLAVIHSEEDGLEDEVYLVKDEPKEDPKSDPLPLFSLTGNYDLFEEIMTQTYTGEMEAIQLLIKTRFGGMAYLSHGRWHFAIPHISQNQATVFTNTLEPLEEEEDDDEERPPLSNEPSVKAPLSAATTIHNPHKGGSKRLRPYHVTDIKELFERAGYTLETVKDARAVNNPPPRKKK